MPVLVSGPRATQAQHRQRHLLAAKPASSHRVRSNMFTRAGSKGARAPHSIRKPPLLPTKISGSAAASAMTSDFYLHGRFPRRCLCSPPEEQRPLIPPSIPGRQRQPLAQQPKGSSASGSTTTTTVAATETTPQRFCCSQQQLTSVAPQRLCCSQQQLKRSDAATFQALQPGTGVNILIGTGNEETAGNQTTATPQPTLAWRAAATNTVSAESVPLHEHSRPGNADQLDTAYATKQLDDILINNHTQPFT